MQFTLFDPEAETAITHRNLPHWFQAGACYFITFRTADSLPAAVVADLLRQRRHWLASHGIDPDAEGWFRRLGDLPQAQQADYHRTFSDGFHRYLDAGHGDCLLRRPEVARVVSDSFGHFDGARYDLADYVIMPNHVHLLVGLRGGTQLADVCYSWKKFTSTQINKLLGRRGHFWQGESFDHIVRTGEQFEYLRGYIAANPEKAKLKVGEYVLYQAELSPTL